MPEPGKGVFYNIAILPSTETTVGNAVPGVPTAEGGCSVRISGTVLAHRTRRNAGDGVPYTQIYCITQTYRKSRPSNQGFSGTYSTAARNRAMRVVGSI